MCVCVCVFYSCLGTVSNIIARGLNQFDGILTLALGLGVVHRRRFRNTAWLCWIIYKRTLKMPHYKLAAMMIISLRIQDISAKIFSHRKYNQPAFHTKTKTSMQVIYVIQYDYQTLPKIQQKQPMRTKHIHQVQHGIWKETA